MRGCAFVLVPLKKCAAGFVWRKEWDGRHAILGEFFDVHRTKRSATPRTFGSVPTPALVAPLEFTLPKAAYLALGGHETAIRSLTQVLADGGEYATAAQISAWPGGAR